MSSQSDKAQRRHLRELAELAYERELSRELFSRYQRSNEELVVAQAIHSGVISRDEAGAGMLKHLAGHLRALKS